MRLDAFAQWLIINKNCKYPQTHIGIDTNFREFGESHRIPPAGMPVTHVGFVGEAPPRAQQDGAIF